MLILADQWRADSVTPSLTPHLTALQTSSVTFRTCITNAPLCRPARITLMTGQPVSEHGFPTNHGVPRPTRHPSHVRDLQAAGYRTMLVGKSHLTPGYGHLNDHRPVLAAWGFDTAIDLPDAQQMGVRSAYTDWLGEERTLRRRRYLAQPDWTLPCDAFGLTLDDHLDVFCAELASAQIREHDGSRPLYLQVSWIGDLNGDGRADLHGRSWIDGDQWPSVHFGTAAAGFDHAIVYNPLQDGVTQGSLTDLGDLDGDGAHELWLSHPGLQGADAYSALWFSGSSVEGPPDLLLTEDALPSWAGPELIGGFLQNTGDVDGDGFEDVHSGATIYFGPNLERSAPAKEWLPNHAPFRSLGDVTNNGFADLLMRTMEGTLVVGYGGPDGLRVGDVEYPSVAGIDAIYQEHPGTDVVPRGCQSPVGDVDGDGFADLVHTMGITQWDGDLDSLSTGPQQYVHGHVFLGARQALAPRASTSFPPPTRGAGETYIGEGIANTEVFTDCRGLGDVDGDGFGDVGITIGHGLVVFGGGPGGIHPRRTQGTAFDIRNGVVTTW